MEKIFYPTQKTYNRGILWIQRIASMVFLYATLTLPANISLMNTPLVTTLRGEYPTWWHVMWDMCLTVMILAVLFFVGKLLVLYTRSHPVSRKYIEWIRKIDSKFIQNFLNFDFFLVKFLVAGVFGWFLWFLLKGVSPSLPASIHVPLYHTQPVVTVMVILGFIVLVESFQSWKWHMRKHLHMHEKF
ncbi:MAG: hypothetical protein COU32_03155 [Candidatus Magasanikbacteria bacterium CG10_big_fil_rev_8_21_14_0_10_42_10]|uniref:Uncharacterized protein n=2 Tax=Candidatus Magasanikiibacteriota TaxID=1752731 RepID=A0A2H0TVR9_9BACT|nr:MAG: hypothetical protein COU32_03155 [Candidatus Magasanikbacteria bacterium CG10_big_fil_rev_8_21_14_0_10_42_10]PIZ93204.1 MAG: hypothetical protein COX82_03110 [Candidatus Magasanikbacteria bacterium CG_4_10_14_0_2_um_filter_41_10]